MFRVFEGRTADSVWCEIADAFRNGEGAEQPSRVGEMREILHSAMSISNPTQRWITSRTPAINVAFALAEVIWIITGRHDSAFLNYFNRQLPKFAGQTLAYHGAYGRRLRSHLGIDQLQRAYDVLTAKPSSRQIVLQIWDSKIDLPRSSGEEASADVPCNVASILKVRDGKLHWMQIMRSNDVYRGLPYNIVQFTTIQEVIAGWLGLQLGEYNQISNSLHVYARDLDRVSQSRRKPAPVNTDSLAATKDESEQYFRALSGHVETIMDQDNTSEELISVVNTTQLPAPFRNILCVLTAEGLRRRRVVESAVNVMSCCRNPVYRHLFDQWLIRCEKTKVPRSTISAFGG
jgi:thymidylate synthase